MSKTMMTLNEASDYINANIRDLCDEMHALNTIGGIKDEEMPHIALLRDSYPTFDPPRPAGSFMLWVVVTIGGAAVGHVVRVSRELDRVFSAFDNEHGYDRRIPEITANIRDIAKVRH